MKTNAAFKQEFRWLSPSDEHQLIALLKEVYNHTYSYQDLYRPGKLTTLLEEAKLKSLGIFKENRLYGHTALLLKDSKNEYVESGMSFKNNSKENISREREVAATSFLYDYVNENHFFMHQNTTTYHPFAQAYARKAFKAQAVGFIFEYAQNEELAGIDHHDRPMNALVMTSVLKEAQSLHKKIYLPEDLWGRWVSLILKNLKLNRSVEFIDCKTDFRDITFNLDTIELNSALNLKRANLHTSVKKSLSSLHKSFDLARVKLVHLKMNEVDIQENFNFLLDNHFYPVAVRPHQYRDDEIIFQKFNQKLPEVVSALNESKVYNNEDWSLIQKWMEIIEGHL